MNARSIQLFASVAIFGTPARASGQDPFAVTVLEYAPAPGQFINNSTFDDPAVALGPPIGGGTSAPSNASVVTLGGFGGSITLGFDHTVLDDAANPHGMDAIVFGNAFWADAEGNGHFAECGHIEISLDLNANGQPDDPWYLIPGSHIDDLDAQYDTQAWDDDFGDPTFPPANPAWWDFGWPSSFETHGYRLPALFEANVVVNPGKGGQEGIFGYADYAPTLILGDLDADNIVDDPNMLAGDFYTFPDNPYEVGITPGSGGGDAFDIAWAVDPVTGAPAGLGGFDFVRITVAVNVIDPLFGESSSEIDAVADVSPGLLGDGNYDGIVDVTDLSVLISCLTGPTHVLVDPTCRVMDLDGNDRVDLVDFVLWQHDLTEPEP